LRQTFDALCKAAFIPNTALACNWGGNGRKEGGKNSENSCCQMGGYGLFIAESAPVLVLG
jgi:hypothetical protein